MGALVLLAACGDDFPLVDAAVSVDAGATVDLGISSDGGGLLHGGFTIIGCTTIDSSRDPVRCAGPAPLSLTFVPVGGGVSTFVWSFPGGMPDQAREQSPSTVYASPGSYQVRLAAGGAAGTTTANAVVQVTAGGVGAPCGSDGECDGSMGLSCLCQGGGCVAGLSVGFCTRTCIGGGCGLQAACADFTRADAAAVDAGVEPPVDGGSSVDAPDGGDPLVLVDPWSGPWREALCVPGCTSDTDCRAGLSCRELPVLASGQSGGGASLWQRGCFANVLGDVSASCVDGNRQPNAEACLSRRCDGLGARGSCTQACSTDADCPSFAGCVTFAGGEGSVCLVRCDATHLCAGDPLLGCEAPGASGVLGFTVAEPATSATFCAPKSCAMASDCKPAGTCADSHCAVP